MLQIQRQPSNASTDWIKPAMFRLATPCLVQQCRIASPICKLSFAARLSHSYTLGRSVFVARVPTRAFSQSLSLGYNKDGFTKKDYDGISDGTIDGIIESIELLSEKRPDLDAEYNSGVLTITTPQGTYIINKQPPNRQIWLSSPVSGPNRFDWDPINLIWKSARDDSTLGGILKKEIGIEFYTTLPLGYL